MRYKSDWYVVVFEHFKKKYPDLAKKVASYEPYGYCEIGIIFIDGSWATYNHETKRLTIRE